MGIKLQVRQELNLQRLMTRMPIQALQTLIQIQLP